MRHHTTHTRDAALLRLNRINRWVIAGSIVLTGVLADVAAHAFPGKNKQSSTAGHRDAAHKGGPTGVLAAPEQAPEGSGSSESDPSGGSEREGSTGSEGSGSGASGSEASGGESGGESGGSGSAGGEASQSPSGSESSSGSEESSGPVVSGGS
jgi:hypothetical protein